MEEATVFDGRWECGVVAYDWAFRVRREYTEHSFFPFDAWLQEYVRGWGDCDDFCTHDFGAPLSAYPEQFDRVMTWTGPPISG